MGTVEIDKDKLDELIRGYVSDAQAQRLLEKARHDVRKICFELYPYVTEAEEERIKDAEMQLVTTLFELAVNYDGAVRGTTNKIKQMLKGEENG